MTYCFATTVANMDLNFYNFKFIVDIFFSRKENNESGTNIKYKKDLFILFYS